jgi:hypothetical protein
LNGTKKSKGLTVMVTLILASLFALFMATGFVPNAAAWSSCNVENSWTSSCIHPPPTSCEVVWSSPTGSYAPGAKIQFTITDPCHALGIWKLVSAPGGPILAWGIFSCPCKDKVLYSGTAGTSPLIPGKYILAGGVANKNWTFSFEVDNFIVTNALPLGTIAAAGVSLVGLLAVRRYSRTLSYKTPKV